MASNGYQETMSFPSIMLLPAGYQQADEKYDFIHPKARPDQHTYPKPDISPFIDL
jgi:hypothetical protein